MHRCNLINLNSFDLMIALAANKSFMRSKFAKGPFKKYVTLLGAGGVSQSVTKYHMGEGGVD